MLTLDPSLSKDRATPGGRPPDFVPSTPPTPGTPTTPTSPTSPRTPARYGTGSPEAGARRSRERGGTPGRAGTAGTTGTGGTGPSSRGGPFADEYEEYDEGGVLGPYDGYDGPASRGSRGWDAESGHATGIWSSKSRRSANLPPPPLRTCRWTYPEVRPRDKIGDITVDLSAPGPRGGHSLVAINSTILVTFGGYFCRWEAGGEERPFREYETALLDDPKIVDDGADYLAQLHSFDTIAGTWQVAHCLLLSLSMFLPLPLPL